MVWVNGSPLCKNTTACLEGALWIIVSSESFQHVIQTIEMNIVMSHYKSFFTEHIQNIMTLEESVQHVVMTAIQVVGNSS